MIDWIKHGEKDHLNEMNYSLDKLKEEFDVRELCEDGWLILNMDENKLWLKFVVMQYSDCDGTNTFVKTVFHGYGPSDNLRECRHTWWGDSNEEGYIFYPKADIIIASLNALKEFYEMD